MITKEQALKVAEKYLDEQYANFEVFGTYDKLWGNAYDKDRLNNIKAYFVCCIRKEPLGTGSSYALVISKEDARAIEFINSCDEG